MEFNLVVKNSKGQYLDKNDEWVSAEKAWLYGSTVAFNHADVFDGKVFLRTKVREIEITPEDVGL